MLLPESALGSRERKEGVQASRVPGLPKQGETFLLTQAGLEVWIIFSCFVPPLPCESSLPQSLSQNRL
jgi:hypothetical protein